MIVSQGAGATQAITTGAASASATLNAGNRAAPYLLIHNRCAVVTFVNVSTTAAAATTGSLPVAPNESVVIGNPKPMESGTNITVAAINVDATAGVVYVTGVDVVGT